MVLAAVGGGVTVLAGSYMFRVVSSCMMSLLRSGQSAKQLYHKVGSER
jgi:hypothetical protein